MTTTSSASTAVVDEPASTPAAPAGPVRSRGPVIAIVAIAVTVIALVLVGTGRVLPTIDAQDAPSAGSWSYRAVAGSEPVTDEHGVRWPGATSLAGGRQVTVPGGASGTASPQLYRQARVGARSWTVAVPNPGRYAVDLLVVQPDGTAPAGSDVFDLLVDDGEGEPVPVRRGVELVSAPLVPQHVTGIVEVRSTELTLEFDSVVGEPAVTGLIVTTMGSAEPSTLLDEEFDGPAGAPVPAPWTAVTGLGSFGTGELQGYSAAAPNVAQDGSGNLVLQAEPVAYPDPWIDAAGIPRYQPWTSGQIDTQGQFAVTYGTVSARLQVPPGQGLWPAFWMVGADTESQSWPLSGEIDVLEHVGENPAGLYAAVRAQGDELDAADGAGRRISRLGGSWTAPDPLADDLHTYSAELTPGYVSFAVDGQIFLTVSRVDLRSGQQWPLGRPYFLTLNLAVGGPWGSPPDALTPVPARLLIDSVEVSGWR